MKIDILEDKNSVCLKAAELIHEQIIKNPHSTIGLATGNTMTGVYEKLKILVQERGTDLSSVRFVMLDEYWDIEIEHPASFKSYLLAALKDLGLSSHQFSFHRIELPPDEACDYYEKRIKELGGVDLQLLGIGLNGHIAFNEPGTPFTSKTHVIKLTESTIKANEKDFKGAFPTMAITMGIQTIMDAKNVVLIALGASKAEIIHQSLKGSVSEDCPASVLQGHHHLTVLLDTEAAARLL